MFVCERCHKQTGWSEHLHKSLGVCGICNNIALTAYCKEHSLKEKDRNSIKCEFLECLETAVGQLIRKPESGYRIRNFYCKKHGIEEARIANRAEMVVAANLGRATIFDWVFVSFEKLEEMGMNE